MKYDHLFGLVSPSRVGQATMDVLTGMQRWRIREQPVALALAFLSLCDALGAKPADILTTANNIRNDKYADTPEIRAVRDYMSKHLAPN